MTSISISKLKENPAKALGLAGDYPISIENRNTVQGYLVGKELFEKLLNFIEDLEDNLAVKSARQKKGKDFEKVAKDLEI